MAAVISGNGLGLFNGSFSQLGQGLGSGRLGQGRDSQYVNIANGNLLLRSQDESLVFRGLSLSQVRTYNSQGQLSQVGGDAWLTGYERRIELADGTFNAAGSVMRLHIGDGSYQDFVYSAANIYLSSTGEGAHDSLTWDGGTGSWTYVEGSSRREESYADHADATLKGRLTRLRDLRSDAADTTGWDVLYDADGRISEVRSRDAVAGDGADALVFGYDADGRLSSLSTRENGVVRGQVSYEYDAAGRLAAVLVDLTPEDGNGDRDGWDAANAANNDGHLFRTRYTYADATSLRIVQVAQSDGTLVSYTYDAAGRVRTVTQGDSNADDSDGAGQTLSFDYDPVERRTDVSDATGRTWSYLYDAAGQLVETRNPAQDGLRDSTRYGYDSAGNLVRSETRRGAATLSLSEFRYDADGNLLWEWHSVDAAQGGGATAVQRTYTAANQLESETVYQGLDADGAAAGQAPSGGLTTRYVYDAQNRLRFVIGREGEVREIEYASDGNGVGQAVRNRRYLGASFQDAAASLSALSDWAAAQKGASELSESSYDAKGRLAQVKHYAAVDAAGAGIEDDRTEIVGYVYDAQGLLRQQSRLRSSTQAANDGRDLEQTVSYVYDGLGRLLSEAVGERRTDVAGATPRPVRTTTWRYEDSGHAVKTVLQGGASDSADSSDDLLRIEVRDAAGQLISVTEGAVGGAGPSRTRRHYYDGAGRLVASEDAAGGRSYVFYDAEGQVQAQVDAVGTLTEFVRDAAGRAIQTRVYATAVDTRAWLVDGRVSTTLQQARPAATTEDRTASASYDDLGRVLSETDARGVTTAHVYDALGRRLRSTTSGTIEGTVRERTVRYFYDSNGRETARLDAEGYLVEFVYDRAGRRIRSIGYATPTPEGERAAGGLDQLRPVPAAGDQHSRSFYDGQGQLIAELDAEGGLIEYVYDQAHNQRAVRAYVQKLAPLSGNETLAELLAQAGTGAVRETRRSYDAAGRLTVERNPDGLTTQYVYDAQGRVLSAIRQPETEERRENYRRYDVFGNLVAELDERLTGKVQVEGEWEPRELTAAEIEAKFEQLSLRHAYDALGRRIETTDQDGNKTWFFYDAAGQLSYTVRGVEDAAGVRNALGEVVHTRYSAFGQVRESTAYTQRLLVDGTRAGAATALSTLLYSAASDSRVSYQYDNRGQLLRQTDAEGYTIDSVYDDFGRLVQQTRQIDAGRSHRSDYRYDLRDLQTQASERTVGALADDLTRQTTRRYDAFGRAVETVDARGQVVSHAFDRVGRQIEVGQWIGGLRQSETATYDAIGRVLTKTDTFGNTTTYVYDDKSRSTTESSAEGVVHKTVLNVFGQTAYTADALDHQTRYVYDDEGRLIEIWKPKTLQRGETPAPSLAAWGGQGGGEEGDANAGYTLAASYQYDQRGLLAWSSEGGSKTFEYDAAGRVRRSESDAGLETFEYDGQGRRVATVDAHGVRDLVRYDRNGRTVESVFDDGGLGIRTLFAWDGLGNRLSVTEAAGTSAQRTVVYAYDGLGRRISETVAPGELDLVTRYVYDASDNVVAKTDPAGRLTRFVYDQVGRQLYAVDAAGGVVETVYDLAGRVLASRAYASAISLADLPVAATEAQIRSRLNRDDLRDRQEYRTLDRDGRVVYSIDGGGAVVHSRYTATGRLAQTRRYVASVALTPALRAQLLAGDPAAAASLADWAAQSSGAGDLLNSYVYDERGALQLSIGPSGIVTETTYDDFGRLIDSRTFGAELSAGDGHDRVASGEAERDLAGFQQIVESVVVPADVRAKSYGYDVFGRLSHLYEYDKYGASNDWSPVIVTELVYDAVGRLFSETRYHNSTTGSDGSGYYSMGGSNWTPLSHDEDRVTRTVYDAAGRKRFVIDPVRVPTEYRYNAAGEVIETRTYGNPVSPALWGHDPDNWSPRVPTEQDLVAAVAGFQDVRVSQQSYDAAGRVKTRTDANQNSESYTYDATGLLLSHTNRDGHTWTYDYDAAGRRTVETSPQVAIASADAAGNVSLATRSVVTRTVYDALGNVLSRSEDADSARPRTTDYVYDNRGNQIRTIFPDAGRLDAAGNLVATGLRPAVEVTYDSLGRAVMQKDVRGNYSHKVYDLAGRALYEVDQEGYVTGYAYNPHGEAVLTRRFAVPVDAPAGQPLSLAQIEALLVRSADDRVLATRYSQRGHTVEVTQMRNAGPATGAQEPLLADGDWRADTLTRFKYNPFGELIEEAVLIARDVALDWVRDRRDWTSFGDLYARTNHFYDKAGNRVATIDPQLHLTTWTYTGRGEVAEQTEYARSVFVEVHWWDSQHVVVWTTPDPGDATTGYDRTIRYGYDALGRKTSETVQRRFQHADGVADVRDVVTTTAYDKEGHVVAVTADGQTTATVYDALGRVLSVKEAERKVVRADAQAQLQANAGLGLDAAGLYEWVSPYSTMAYDAFGNVIQLRRYANGLRAGESAPQASAGDLVHTTRYDGQGRGVWERDTTGVIHFKQYDAADNLLSTRYTLHGNAGQSAVVTTQATYDRTGRQTTLQTARELYLNGVSLASSVIDSASQVRYNAFGEIIGKDTDLDPRLSAAQFKAQYAYDHAGRLVRSNEDGVWREYRYDLAGRQTESWYQLRAEVAAGDTQLVEVKTRNVYDRLGRVVDQTLPANAGAPAAHVKQSYDRWGNVVQATDARGYVTDYQYNSFNQVVLETRPEVRVVNANGTEAQERPQQAWYYDALGRLVGQRDAHGNLSGVEYDAVGQAIARRDRTGALNRSAYDVFGQLVLTQSAVDYLTFREYDRAGRVVAHGDFSYGGAGRLRHYREQYALNENGDRLTVTNAAGKVTSYDYDSRNKLLKSRTAAGLTTAYAYDRQGNKIRETNALSDPSLIGQSGARRSHVDRENETVYLDEQTWDYDYFGRLIDHNDLGGVDYDYIYDPVTGQLLRQSVSSAGPGTPNPNEGQAPTAPNPVQPDQVEAYQLWDQTLPASTFVDPQGEPVRFVGAYRIGPFGRDPLPDWMAFDPATGRFFGVPQSDENFDIEVVAADPAGHEGSTWFRTSFLPPPTGTMAPVQNSRIAHQVVENGNWSLDVSSVFSPEPLVGGTLTYQVMLAGSLATGASLSFDPATQTFSGSFPSLAQAQVYTVVLAATGSNGSSLSQAFTVTVPGTGTQGAQAAANDGATAPSSVGEPWIPGIPAPVYAVGNRHTVYYADGRVKEIREDTTVGQNWTRYTYDASGNRTSEESFSYDADGKPLHIRTTTEYDSHNRIARVTQDDIGQSWRNGDPPPNAGFEDGDVGWRKEAGWEILSDPQGGDAHTGGWSARYNGSGAATSIISNIKARVEPGQVINASVMVQQGASSSGAAGARVLVIWLDANGNMLPGGEGRSYTGGNVVDSGSGGEWHQSRVTATVPPGAVYMTIGASARKSTSQPLWVDDFAWSYQPAGSGGSENPVMRRLMDVRYGYDALGNRRLVEAGTAYNPAGNPPINASFEDGAEVGWDLDAGWSIVDDDHGGDANTGSHSARFDLTGNGRIVSKTRAPVEAGQIVNASVMVQQGASSEGQAGAMVMILWFDQSGNPIGSSNGNMVDSGSGGRWHQSRLTATVPPGAKTMAIAAYAYRSGGGDPLWVDDFAWSYKSSDDDTLAMSQSYWFDYDAENRVRVANGKMVNGQIVLADDDVSYALIYDGAGRAIRRRYVKDGAMLDQVTDYDLRDQRTVVWQATAVNGQPTAQAESFSYDAMGRQTAHRSYDASGLKKLETTAYDDDGRSLWQSTFGRSADGSGYGEYAEGEGLALLSKVDYQARGGYDAAGRLAGYTYGMFRREAGGATSGPSAFTHTYGYSYQGRDSYLESGVWGYSSDSNFKASNTSSSYDAWGRRIAIAEQTPNQEQMKDRLRYFAYDGEGNILRRREGELINGVFQQDTTAIGQTQIYAYVSGQQVASGKYNGELDIIGRLTAYDASETGSFRITVQAGDTLRSIAQRVYGNANLWYLLAEANAITDEQLIQGTTLVVPNAKVTANDATTFKPFDPNQAIGNTSPTLPYILPPPKQHCGALAKVIQIVVTAVVSFFVAPLGPIAAAAIGAAAGNHAGQMASLMLNGQYDWGRALRLGVNPFGGNSGDLARSIYDPAAQGAPGKIDYRSIAVSAGTAAATRWVSQLTTDFGPAINTAAQVATSYAANYQLSKWAGYDVSWSNRQLGSNLASAYASDWMFGGGDVDTRADATSTTRAPAQAVASFDWKDLVRGFAQNVGRSAIQHASDRAFGVRDASWNWKNVTADAFGNALGNAAVKGLQSWQAGRAAAQADPMAQWHEEDRLRLQMEIAAEEQSRLPAWIGAQSGVYDASAYTEVLQPTRSSTEQVSRARGTSRSTRLYALPDNPPVVVSPLPGETWADTGLTPAMLASYGVTLANGAQSQASAPLFTIDLKGIYNNYLDFRRAFPIGFNQGVDNFVSDVRDAGLWAIDQYRYMYDGQFEKTLAGRAGMYFVSEMLTGAPNTRRQINGIRGNYEYYRDNPKQLIEQPIAEAKTWWNDTSWWQKGYDTGEFTGENLPALALSEAGVGLAAKAPALGRGIVALSRRVDVAPPEVLFGGSGRTERMLDLAEDLSVPPAANIGTGFVRFRADYDAHILFRDYDVPSKRGIGGAHNAEEFMRYSSEFRILTIEEHPTVIGLKKISYQMAAKDPKTGLFNGQYRERIFDKTVFDPKIISPEEFLSWGRQAAAHGQSLAPLNRTWFGTAPNGLSFMGYLDDTGAVKTFYPDF